MTNEQHAQALEELADWLRGGVLKIQPVSTQAALRAAIAALRAPQGLTRLTDQDIADLDAIREFIGPDKPLRDILTWLRSLPPVSPATEQE